MHEVRHSAGSRDLFKRMIASALAALTVWMSPVVWAETLVVASILPNSRSVELGTPATLFASVLNAGSMEAMDCGVSLPPEMTALGATFSFQTTDPATNSPVGAVNQPVNILPGAVQTFVLRMEPSQEVAAVEITPLFQCENASPAGTILGVNTFTFAASSTPVPDVVALAATPTSDGIVNIPSATGINAFSVASINLGIEGMISATAELSTPGLPVSITACETDPATAECINPTSPTPDPIDTTIAGMATPTFSFFVTGSGDVPFDPATNRAVVRFTDQVGEIRGATSVALRTTLAVPRLDESFATGGFVEFDASTSDDDSNRQSTMDSIVLANGQILLVGTQDGATFSDDLTLRRINVDGTIDNSFGDEGLVIVSTSELMPTGIRFGFFIRVVELADGQLMVLTDADDDLLFLRFTADGLLDTSFGNAGVSTLDISGQEDGLRDAVSMTDGGIVVVGAIDNPASSSASDPFVLRLTADGILDPTFGTNGVSIVSALGPDVLSNSFDAVTQTADGRIVAVGVARNSTAFDIGDDLLLARFMENGSPDGSFGDAGLAVLDTGSSGEVLIGVDTNSAGEVFATGERNNDQILLKLLENGTLDTSFGTQGFVFLDLPDDQGNEVSNSGEVVIVQPNNTLLAIGSFANSGCRRFVVTSFTENGALVPNFGDAGIFSFDFDEQDDLCDSFETAVQDEQGRLITATSANTELSSDTNVRVSGFIVR